MATIDQNLTQNLSPISVSDTKMSKFSVKAVELKELMQASADEMKQKLKESFEGLSDLALGLSVDLTTGLLEDPSDLQSREQFFGRNEIPAKKTKSFLELAFEGRIAY